MRCSEKSLLSAAGSRRNPGPSFIGSRKGALEKVALKSLFWAINAAFYFDFVFIASSNGRPSSSFFGYCIIMNSRGCVLGASFNLTCCIAQEGVPCFFDHYRASPFVRICCMCRAWQARRGDQETAGRDSFTGLGYQSKAAGLLGTSGHQPGPTTILGDNFGDNFH